MLENSVPPADLTKVTIFSQHLVQFSKEAGVLSKNNGLFPNSVTVTWIYNRNLFIKKMDVICLNKFILYRFDLDILHSNKIFVYPPPPIMVLQEDKRTASRAQESWSGMGYEHFLVIYLLMGIILTGFSRMFLSWLSSINVWGCKRSCWTQLGNRLNLNANAIWWSWLSGLPKGTCLQASRPYSGRHHDMVMYHHCVKLMAFCVFSRRSPFVISLWKKIHNFPTWTFSCFSFNGCVLQHPGFDGLQVPQW